MLISAEFVTAVVGETKTAEEEVRALLRVAENVTGAANKGQAAQWLVGAVTALRIEREMRAARDHGSEQTFRSWPSCWKAIGCVDLPESEKTLLNRRLGDLGGLVEADAQIVAPPLRSPLPAVQRLNMLRAWLRARSRLQDRPPPGPRRRR